MTTTLLGNPHGLHALWRFPPCLLYHASMMVRCVAMGIAVSVSLAVWAEPATQFQLTARPWSMSNFERQDLIGMIEGVCRFAADHIDEHGAFVDPILGREHQYATPYFAYAVGALLAEGHGEDLKELGIRAMDHATALAAAGNAAIPDQHGEFFIAPLADALEFYAPHVDAAVPATWHKRLSVPVTHIIESITAKTNNWRTYAMKGEWSRYRAGLVSQTDAETFIEDGWLRRTQRERIMLDAHNLYQDWNGHPQSHAVEAVGRGNLAALAFGGYDGPSADAIRSAVLRGTETSLLLQDPTGQCPPNGRTDNHVFNDVLYGLIFDAAAEAEWARGETSRAGQYRRAASLAYQSIARWKRTDVPWAGSYSITKNFFDPADRVGYQPASQYGNYTGAVMYHLAEALHTRRTHIPERPAPAEIGGYVFATDPRFGSAVANAGGMQVFLNLLGDSVPKYNAYWTPLGAVRVARPGWDSRLGPSDGARDYASNSAVTLAPTWKMGERWVRLADMAEHYQGTLRVDFVHPFLIRCSVLYAPVTGVGGPNFFLDLTITPDGVLISLHSPHPTEFALTIPLLEHDGRALEVTASDTLAGTRYPDEIGNGDEQWFLAIGDTRFAEDGPSVRSTYGDLKPLRAETSRDRVEVFIYPRSIADPSAEEVLGSFVRTGEGFESVLGEITGERYTGRWAAGGYGRSFKVLGGELTVSEPCRVLIQHGDSQLTAMETDRDVSVQVGDWSGDVQAHRPRIFAEPQS